MSEPCEGFDKAGYLGNLTARFFLSGGTDLYYLSHPETHRCLGLAQQPCAYLEELRAP
jgi:hypothetical protein